MTEISKLAVVNSSAQIGTDVRIGPFCVIGPDVQIGDGCALLHNVTIDGHTRIGEGNVFYQNVVVGAPPQDLKYDGAPTETIVGSHNVFRENVTVHRGTELGLGKTVIGDNNLLMVAAHVAHDCILEDKILLGNETLLAGHVKIEEGAVVSALVGIHHFVTIGQYSYVGGLTPVRRDVPPFVKASGSSGDRAKLYGLNSVGLKRHGFSQETLLNLERAYRIVFRIGLTMREAVERVKAEVEQHPEVAKFIEFLQTSERGITR